jgi:hypothetical protein
MDEVHEAKQNAFSRALKGTLVIIKDVQSALLCPKLLVSKHCYTKKLVIWLYILSLNNKDTHLYVWHEGDSKIMPNEFTTCIVNFIKNVRYKK